MMEELKKKVNAVYNWTVEDGNPKPPKQDLPQAVKDRADYFWDMAEDGMTFMGAMECIFADEKPTDYDWGATKGWLPKSKEFDDWISSSNFSRRFETTRRTPKSQSKAVCGGLV